MVLCQPLASKEKEMSFTVAMQAPFPDWRDIPLYLTRYVDSTKLMHTRHCMIYSKYWKVFSTEYLIVTLFIINYQ